MKRLCFILGLFIGAQALAAPICSEVFEGRREESAFGALAPFYVAAIKTIDTSLQTTSFYRETPDGLLYRTDIQRVYHGEPGRPTKFLELAEENIQFVLANYMQRRDWKPEYLESIRNDALAYASRATYFVSRRLQHEEDTGKIVGTLKVIAGSKNSLLPFEKEHGIRVPTNNGKKFEPGNFVVLKEDSQWAFSEVMLRFINFAKNLQLEPGYEPGKMVFFTDADQASSMMYRQLGFKSVPGFEAPLVKDGKEYHLIGASAEDVLGFVDVFQKKRKEWAGDHASGFSRLAEMLSRHDISQPDIQGKSFGDVTSFDKKGNVDALTPLTVHFSKIRETERGVGHRLSIDRQGLVGLQVNYLIPEGQVVQEGWSYSPRSNIEMSYFKGIFFIREKIGSAEEFFWIKTNPSFSSIQGITYRRYKMGELSRELTSSSSLVPAGVPGAN
ncbi:hypothetical protein [Bdellovibrio svalbardensis]|uniref:Uncharacterized protein n=1 Tax=Bdellovibrio svalbardensis TaxID=2972972 RepID=A0ABT6DN04_9BACT|nr:hypothetical protein [Bdellovibrio svalbardensis]MDG0818260.1 hypothetical protein [Bdellovibrio svalbardensis]